MGTYPTTFTPSVPAGFATFVVTSHAVDGYVQTSDDVAGRRDIRGHGASDDNVLLIFSSSPQGDTYSEHNWSEAAQREVHTYITDSLDGVAMDIISVDRNTISRPSQGLNFEDTDATDTAFIDVDVAAF